MIPFNQTWPYDIIMNDIYVHECPFCQAENIILPLKPKELISIREGKKNYWCSLVAVIESLY